MCRCACVCLSVCCMCLLNCRERDYIESELNLAQYRILFSFLRNRIPSPPATTLWPSPRSLPSRSFSLNSRPFSWSPSFSTSGLDSYRIGLYIGPSYTGMRSDSIISHDWILFRLEALDGGFSVDGYIFPFFSSSLPSLFLLRCASPLFPFQLFILIRSRLRTTTTTTTTAVLAIPPLVPFICIWLSLLGLQYQLLPSLPNSFISLTFPIR